MKKISLLVLLLTIIGITGCGNKTVSDNHVKKNTEKVLNSSSKTWVFDKSISSNMEKHTLSNDISVSSMKKTSMETTWSTSNKKFHNGAIEYHQVSLKKWKQGIESHVTKEAQNTIHYLTVEQINASLKKLGANVTIDQLSDLIFLQTESNGVDLTDGFIADGNHLYQVTAEYRDVEDLRTIERGKSYLDTGVKKDITNVPVDKLNGTWVAPETTTSATDSGKVLIKDGFFYQKRFDSIERSAIQNLQKYSLVSLNQNNTYSEQKRNAARAGYDLSQKSVATGDSLGYLYIFLSKEKMLRIGGGQTVTYDKLNNIIAPSDLSTNEIDVFKNSDNHSSGQTASTLTAKSDASFLEMSKSINYLTDPEAGQITDRVPAE
ncbi:hypothetical protein [Companilactobacillus mishanensis]|uniref:Lipoprotein n=1 Tax=Companilactobacillus mishanensis TaxID=2486008 RepID=A0ABW9P724_9LACO|nr:hypothetical protein [Companilactobacillus mishanensis]MQS44995.1 hypothetical protein [Companilactobacillus mishanensis]